MSKLLNIPHDDYKVYSGKTIIARFDTWIETHKYLSENTVPNLRVEKPNPRAKMSANDIAIAEFVVKTWGK